MWKKVNSYELDRLLTCGKCKKYKIVYYPGNRVRKEYTEIYALIN